MGHLVGSEVVVEFKRTAGTEIPDGRIDWLFDLWASVDGWVLGELNHLPNRPKRNPQKLSTGVNSKSDPVAATSRSQRSVRSASVS